MINLKTIEQLDTINNLAKRGYFIPEQLTTLLAEKKQINIAIEEIQAKINRHEDVDKNILKHKKEAVHALNNKINDITHLIPNLLHNTVPEGKGEDDNVVLAQYFDELKHTHNQHHTLIGKRLGLDIETGVELAHTRFTVMKGQVAVLHRKLINMAMDFYTHKGYEEFYVPLLVNEETMFGTGQYPKFKEELFMTEGNKPLYLVPTGEVPLTNVFKNKILPIEQAQQQLVTHTPCFRKEAGAYGKDTKGIIRQHQFEKIELVRTCLPENGLATFEHTVNDIVEFVKQFKIPFRVIELCAGDIGFAGHKAYDIEIWFPTENKYREIATVTWCHDFQARRMNAKVKRNEGKKELLHTLNGTGLAVGRVLAAILENYPNTDLNYLPFLRK
jgi:seryl-tRNA synthetase